MKCLSILVLTPDDRSVGRRPASRHGHTYSGSFGPVAPGQTTSAEYWHRTPSPMRRCGPLCSVVPKAPATPDDFGLSPCTHRSGLVPDFHATPSLTLSQEASTAPKGGQRRTGPRPPTQSGRAPKPSRSRRGTRLARPPARRRVRPPSPPLRADSAAGGGDDRDPARGCLGAGGGGAEAGNVSVDHDRPSSHAHSVQQSRSSAKSNVSVSPSTGFPILKTAPVSVRTRMTRPGSKEMSMRLVVNAAPATSHPVTSA